MMPFNTVSHKRDRETFVGMRDHEGGFPKLCRELFEKVHQGAVVVAVDFDDRPTKCACLVPKGLETTGVFRSSTLL